MPGRRHLAGLRGTHGRSRALAVIGAILAPLVALSGCVSNGPRSARPPSPAVLKAAPYGSACVALFHSPCDTPAQVRAAYDLDPLYERGLDGAGETVAVVALGGSPTITQDLGHFDAGYHLPPPPSLRTAAPDGSIGPFNPRDPLRLSGAGDTSLDVEWIHALAPGARLLVVEVPMSTTETDERLAADIAHAIRSVVERHLADVILESVTLSEAAVPRRLHAVFKDARRAGVTIVAPTGDQGPIVAFQNCALCPVRHPYDISWPAADPLVTAVGGVTLHLDAAGRRTAPDSAWNDSFSPIWSAPNPRASGGGLSNLFNRPGYQRSVMDVASYFRAVPDISMSAGLNGGAPTYHTFPGLTPGYHLDFTTNEAAADFAAIVAIADEAAGRSLGFLNPMLYQLAATHAPGIVDVTQGNTNVAITTNGRAVRIRGWDAGPGYDLATGLGTVDAGKLVPELADLANASRNGA